MAQFKKIKIIMTCLAGSLALLSGSIVLASEPQVQEATPLFDLSHAREAINYFENPTNANISRVAFTPAAEKLRQYLNATTASGFLGQTSTFESSKNLLKQNPSLSTFNQGKAVLTLIADNQDKQKQCYEKTLEHLPDATVFEQPLYIIWGHGSVNNEAGIFTTNSASMLDITHSLYQQTDEIWTQCIHAIHHAAMLNLNPIPFNIMTISRTDELLALIEHQTMFEGSAQYAANPEGEHGINTQVVEEFEQMIDNFTGPPRFITEDDWQIIESNLDAASITGQMGAFMAQEIDIKLGRQALVNAYKGGAASFFQSYRSLGSIAQ